MTPEIRAFSRPAAPRPASLKSGLIAARTNLVFLAGLGLAVGLIVQLEGLADTLRQPDVLPLSSPSARLVADSTMPALPTPAPLSAEERAWAETAWVYFENNTDPATGLVSSGHGYPSTTMWDTGSYILAAISAARLGVIAPSEARTRLARVLSALEAMPLVDGRLPNKAYDTRSLAMTDYVNRPVPEGLGWSGLDMARLVIALTAVSRFEPRLGDAVARVSDRYDYDALVRDGVIFGTTRLEDGSLAYRQEGRVGYEEYGAKGLLIAGIDTSRALEVDDTVTLAAVGETLVPVDTRGLATHATNAMATSEPYILDGLEFGFDWRSGPLAWTLFEAQAGRHAATGIPTAVSEDHIAQAPYFLYGTVYGNGDPWAVLTSRGERRDDLRSLSTKAAFAWASLFPGDYAEVLEAAALPARSDGFGWYAGVFEATGEANRARAANTNAVVLEALHFRAFGPLLPSLQGQS